jgi:hypothetical protein
VALATIHIGPVPVEPLTTRNLNTAPGLAPGVTYGLVPSPVGSRFRVDIETPIGREIDTYEVRTTAGGLPTDGIFLVSVTIQNKAREIVFDAPAGLEPKLLSFPVDDQSVNAVAVDPVRKTSLTIVGSVAGRKPVRLEGCGIAVDAWKFSGSRVFQELDSGIQFADSTYELYFAPQLGGLVVGDHYVTHAVIGPLTYDGDWSSNIGDLAPITK